MASGRQCLAPLRRAEAEIVSHGAGKQVGPLRHHAEFAAQFTRLDIVIVLALDKHRSRGGLVEPVQQSQQRSLARTAGAGDGQDLSFPQFKVRVLNQDLVVDGSSQVLGSQDDRVGIRDNAHVFVILSGVSPFACEWAGGVEGPLSSLLAPSAMNFSLSRLCVHNSHDRPITVKGVGVLRLRHPLRKRSGSLRSG